MDSIQLVPLLTSRQVYLRGRVLAFDNSFPTCPTQENAFLESTVEIYSYNEHKLKFVTGEDVPFHTHGQYLS